MYIVELSQRAQDFLNKLDTDLKERVEKRLKNLENNPVTSDAKFIGRIDKEKDFDLLINNLVAKQLKIP